MPMEIQTPEGRVKAMTPVILSASRSVIRYDIFNP